MKTFFQITLILLLIFLILIFFADIEPKTFIAFNEKPYRELKVNDEGQRDEGTLNKYTHFSTWKTSVYISIIDQKNATIFWEAEMNSCV